MGSMEAAALGPTMGTARAALARALDALLGVSSADAQTVSGTLSTVLTLVERLDGDDAADGLATAIGSLRAGATRLAARSGEDPVRRAALPHVVTALSALEQIERFLSQVIDPGDRSTLMLTPEEAAAPALAHEAQRQAFSAGVAGELSGLPSEASFGDSLSVDVELDGLGGPPAQTASPSSLDEDRTGIEELRLDFSDDGLRFLGLSASGEREPTPAPAPVRAYAPPVGPARGEPRPPQSGERQRPSPAEPMPAHAPQRGFPGLTQPLEPVDVDFDSRPTRAVDFDAATVPGSAVISKIARSPEAGGDDLEISVVLTRDEPATGPAQAPVDDQDDDDFGVTREVGAPLVAVPNLDDEPTGRATPLADAMARDALRELALLREQRRPRPGEHWRSRDAAEARLVERIDLVAALGPAVLADFERTLAGWEPGIAFALAVGLGCTDDGDAVRRAAHMLTRDQAADPVISAAIEEGLLLASSPLVREPMAGLLASPFPRVVASAARVLLGRDELLLEEARALVQRSEPELVALGVRGFEGERDSDALNTLRGLLAQDDDGVLDAVLGALAMVGDTTWLDRARELCARGHGDVGRASMWLAIAGSSDELDALITAAATSATPIELDSLGVFGHPAAVPFLLGLLEAQEGNISQAAALALERITGAGLAEADSVDILLGEERQSRSRVDLPMRPSRDPERWRTWWLSHRSDFDATVRWRYGRPFTPGICLEELAERNCSPPDRLRAHYELRIASGSRISFDIGWLLERQQGVFEQWRSWWSRVERRWASGRWPGAAHRVSVRPSG